MEGVRCRAPWSDATGASSRADAPAHPPTAPEPSPGSTLAARSIARHIDRRYPECLNPVCREPSVAFQVAGRIVTHRVMSTIYLHRQLCSVAVEIEDVCAHRVLATKALAIQPPTSEVLPEDNLGQRHFPAQRLGEHLGPFRPVHALSLAGDAHRNIPPPPLRGSPPLKWEGRSERPCAELAVQLAHAAQPAVVVVGLAAHVVEHLRVGQNEEGLRLDRPDAGLGRVLRLQHPVH